MWRRGDAARGEKLGTDRHLQVVRLGHLRHRLKLRLLGPRARGKVDDHVKAVAVVLAERGELREDVLVLQRGRSQKKESTGGSDERKRAQRHAYVRCSHGVERTTGTLAWRGASAETEDFRTLPSGRRRAARSLTSASLLVFSARDLTTFSAPPFFLLLPPPPPAFPFTCDARQCTDRPEAQP